MRIPDDVRLVKGGLRVSPQFVSALSLANNSPCWGLWVRGQREHQRDTTQKWQGRHLVLSPLHPNMWTSVFHLEAKLDSHVGALAVFTELLAKHGVNVLYVTSPLSGYRQVTFTALCDLPELRESVADLVSPSNPTTDKPDSRFQQIGWKTLRSLSKVYAALRLAEHELWKGTRDQRRNPPTSGFFLHSRNVEIGPQPWYLKWSSVQDHVRTDVDDRTRLDAEAWVAAAEQLSHSDIFIERADNPTEEAEWFRRLPFAAAEKLFYLLWREHWMSPLTMRALLTLTYSRVWSVGSAPMRFTYDAASTMLTAADEEYFCEAFVGKKLAVPSVAVASLHTVDRFARLRFLDDAEQPFRVSVGYTLRRPSDPGPTAPPPSTRGFLAGFASALSEEGIDIVDIANTVRFSSGTREEGALAAMGLWPHPPAEPLRAARDLEGRVEDNVRARLQSRADSEPGVKVDLRVQVRPYRGKPLFLSIAFDALNDYRPSVEEVAAELGFDVLVSQRFTSDREGAVTEGILKDLRTSSAMLQVTIHEDPGEVQKAPSDYQWLDFEYGAARMLGLPILRLSDTLQGERDVRLDRDCAIHLFKARDLPRFKQLLHEGLRRLERPQ